MRRINWRFIFTGLFLIALAIGFYTFMLSVAPQSTDPVGVMQTVGTVSGVASAVGVILIVAGLVGKKAPQK